MQKRKRMKGFTLIELLAVIVILAIIALIAVPVIMNIINKANKSAFKDTAYGIISAGELYFAEQQLDVNGMSEDAVFEFPNIGNQLQIKGELPQSGIMAVTTEGKIAIGVTNGRYCITKDYDEADITVTEDLENCEMPKVTYKNGVMSSENACIKNRTCSDDEIKNGISINVKVNDTENYDFYVISDTGTELTLIMDRNIGTQVAWATKADYNDDTNYGIMGNNNKGPITALSYLNTQTANWTNIEPIKSYTYDNNLNGTTNEFGYQKLEIINGEGVLTSQDGTETNVVEGTSRSRMLTEEEATTLGCTSKKGSCPSWLYENLSSSNTTDAPNGYWSLTSAQSNYYYVCFMLYSGWIYGRGNNHVVRETTLGTRPVITISK